MINIIGLGPGAPEALTIGAIKTIQKSKNVFFRTEKHPTVQYLEGEGIEFKTFDNYYETGTSFDEVYQNIAQDIVNKYNEFEELVYAVPGHPLVAERSVLNLIELCKEKNIEYKILPAVSFVDAMIDALTIDPIEGLKIIDAFDMGNQILDKRIGTIITQVYNSFIASEVKLRLLEYYNDETEIIYVRAAGIEGEESIRRIPLYELDMQEDIDYLTSIYIPKDLENKRDINDLIDIIERLRGNDGCPWDKEQTHESLRNAIIEESYEVADAIDRMDDNAIIEELGDVLLQVIFHASIGKEEGYFDLSDIVEGISNKMIYRHPHIFGAKTVENSKEVAQNWDEIKKVEKGIESLEEDLKSVAKSLPALIRAHKVQSKAKKVGFDWDNVEDASKKVTEELEEVLEVYKSGNVEKITEEVGDLLFACVNVARFLNIDEETALNGTTNKFIKRLSYVEKSAKERGKELTQMTLEEMDDLWDKAKKIEKI
ncbi:MAG: nucleoside triphosphate pyrophosphohydrolase [Clostridium sp.]